MNGLRGPAAPVLGRLLAARGLAGGEWWPFLVQEEGKTLPGGLESLSGFVLTRRGRVFGWWLDWDAAQGDYALERWWPVPDPEREFGADGEFRRARERLASQAPEAPAEPAERADEGRASVATTQTRATRTAPPPVLNVEHLKSSIEEIKAAGGPPPWNRILVRNDRLTATFIYQVPGTQNDHHYHLEDEWWYVAEGELAWEMEGEPEPIRVRAGDFVFAPANRYHLIHVLGDAPAIRIGFSYTGEGHRHDRQDPPPPPVRGPGAL